MDPKLHRLRHSAAHVLAQAVKRLWPETRLGIGPAIEEGFYYDIEPPTPLTEEDLPKIEAEMAKIIEANYSFEQSSMSKADAKQHFGGIEENYKLEIIDGIEDEDVSIFTDGDFMDLCEGPHVKATGKIKAFKLLSLAGAYWRGDENNKQLQRIYGTAFFSKKDLDDFLEKKDEAKKRDHRKLGVSLKLFSIIEEAGAGFIFYQPRGALLRQMIEDYTRDQHAQRGYQPVVTPHVLKSDVWVRSGHYDHYKENMYIFESDEQEWGVKPMNCPGHILIYKTGLHSYREFPMRLFELGTVYRNEKSGVLHGLLRVRGFTQDDAHIFCRQDQLQDELEQVLDFVQQVMKDFKFDDYHVEMSTRPDKFAGDPAQWDIAEDTLQKVLEKKQIPFQMNPGDGAFYGPKIDIHVKDSLGRDWQCATAQLDFVLPKRFDLKYIESDGKEVVPIMIHRAIFGSLERFLGMLIEHYAGAFPAWLAPVQAKLIPISEEQESYAQQVQEQCQAAGLRVEIDGRRETLQARIRDAQVEKVPYMLILGKREAEASKVAVRSRTEGDQGAVETTAFIDQLIDEVQTKR